MPSQQLQSLREDLHEPQLLDAGQQGLARGMATNGEPRPHLHGLRGGLRESHFSLAAGQQGFARCRATNGEPCQHLHGMRGGLREPHFSQHAGRA